MKSNAYADKLRSLERTMPSDSNLLIVSKTRPIEEIQIYYDLGHRDFGENRVQELEMKAEALRDSCPGIRWHMIGHLQSNKVNNLFKVPNLYAIHSVDDQELVDKIVKSQDKLASKLHIFLQFNTSKEVEKSGFETFAELRTAAEAIHQSENLILEGLMTMGTLRTEDFEGEARRCFQKLNELKTRLESEMKLKALSTSMGMSQDYKIALEESSTWIRLGTMMFAV